jgi:hypothetical protein
MVACRLPETPPLDPTGRGVSGCCVGPYTCGYSVSSGCFEFTPGKPNDVCDAKLARAVPTGMGFKACCRPDNRCGFDIDGLGCVPPEALPAIPGDLGAFTCIEEESDAGVGP